MSEAIYPAGHIFNGPNGEGYKLLKDLRAYSFLGPSDIEAFGGAPRPTPGEYMPDWLIQAFNKTGD